MKPEIYYGIPARNEERNIANCLRALDRQNIHADVQTIIAVNGSTDKTYSRAKECIKEYPDLNIKVIESSPGKSAAQNAIASCAKHKDVPITFFDADVVPERQCVKIMLKELNRIDKLVAVGARPVPIATDKLSSFRKMLFNVLNVRALNYEAEISTNDVSAYKWYVDKYPQRNVSKEFEKRAKIFFHGRAFMLKSPDYLVLPNNKNLADDTYLPNYIHTFFGPGTIRIRYDALVYYKPYISLREHFNTYWRVYSDLKNIDTNGAFEHSRKMERIKWDWRYILSRGAGTSVNFLLYYMILKSEHFAYGILPKKTLSEIWKLEKSRVATNYRTYNAAKYNVPEKSAFTKVIK